MNVQCTSILFFVSNIPLGVVFLKFTAVFYFKLGKYYYFIIISAPKINSDKYYNKFL